MRDFGTFYFGEGTLDARLTVLLEEEYGQCSYRFELLLEEGDTTVDINFTECVSEAILLQTDAWLQGFLSGENRQECDGIGWGRVEYLIQDKDAQIVDAIIYLHEAEEYDGTGTYLRIELYGHMLEGLKGYLQSVCRKIRNCKSSFSQSFIDKAEELASRQYDYWCHMDANYPPEYVMRDMVLIEKDGFETMDPWIPQEENVPTTDEPYYGHGDRSRGFDPFAIYGKQKMDSFIEAILRKNDIDTTREVREELIEEISTFFDDMDTECLEGFPDEMSNEEMKELLETWDEFDPCAE